jgi:hypothetical protein
MAKSKLATELHPYYPEDWLNAESARGRCVLKGVPFQATLTWCRQNGLEVSSTGHIRALSLQHYIEREKQEQHERLPLNGNRPFSLLK